MLSQWLRLHMAVHCKSIAKAYMPHCAYFRYKITRIEPLTLPKVTGKVRLIHKQLLAEQVSDFKDR